ncbi:hypothetical protein KSP39_PZI012604 [Platanthera zijinensis]|uniref:Ubiquitin-conjugating enzyme E2C-binding protein n=1 Tax=Platanthera zijinensis TaxID=2320716 RepID=A0AAP0BHZ4_9ASPA
MNSFPLGACNTGRQWRFTWETLAHIPTLRLYLFNPEIDDISAVCRSLESTLRLGESLLVISWRLDGEKKGSCRTSALMIPVPRVIVDPACPVDVKVMGDHIEAKLSLLLPVGHPLAAEIWGDPGSDVDWRLPLTLDSDIEKFSSEGVNFFCKSCSSKLTRQPLRNFVEIPSTNWQEVADNWFGGCCSFGGVSEKLVSKYMNIFDCKVGTCLLDRASVTLCDHDLEGAILEKTSSDLGLEYPISTCCDFSPELTNTSSTCCDLVSLRPCSDTRVQEIDPSFNVYSTRSTLVGTQFDATIDCLKRNFNQSSESHDKMASEFVGERSSKCDFHSRITEATHAAGADGRSEFEASIAGYNAQQSTKVYGSGFLITPGNLSKGIECDELSCIHCSSPLGSYARSKGTISPQEGGIRLFKCYISTSLSVGSPDDIFKKYTLQSIFTNLLIAGAQDELSFRTVVCDLRTKSPILLIVLLNSSAWCCSGFCFENTVTRGLPTLHMQPVVKVLFSVCSASTQVNSIASKKWSARSGSTEEVYMMTRQIEELRRSLESSVAKLPHSCSSLQGMSLSFLESD